MTEEPSDTSIQVTLKVPAAFLKEFDDISGQLGYPRNEAVREAMRRFVDWGFQKVNERHPEKSIALVQGMIGSMFGGIIQEANKLEALKAGQKGLPTGEHEHSPKTKSAPNEARTKTP